MRIVVVDASTLLALHQSTTRRSSWNFIDKLPPPLQPSPTKNRRSDEAREELEEAAIEEFSESGGESAGTGAETKVWRAAFIRRRLTCVVRGASSALAGVAAPTDAADEKRSATRKKDAPEHGDRARVDKFVAAQSEQAKLAKRRRGKSRTSKMIAEAGKPLSGGRVVWDGPTEGSSSYEYRLHDGAAQPNSPRRRAVVDNLASPSECRHAIGASLFGMDGLGDQESDSYNGELTLVASPPERLKPFLGEGGCRLVQSLLWKIALAVKECLGETRKLYLSGALLTRLQPPPRRQGGGSSSGGDGGDSYQYSVAHVDRANVASYDYSAVLYLNSKGVGFKGGDFSFVDESSDEVIEPRSGRCVLFPSGFENLHRVHDVTGGTRFALAAWFTLTESASEGPVEPAHYTLHDPVPPPSKEDVQADGVRLEDLKARLIASGGCVG